MQIRVSALEISVRFNFQSDIEENITLIFLTPRFLQKVEKNSKYNIIELTFYYKKLEHMTLIFVDFYCKKKP